MDKPTSISPPSFEHHMNSIPKIILTQRAIFSLVQLANRLINSTHTQYDESVSYGNGSIRCSTACATLCQRDLNSIRPPTYHAMRKNWGRRSNNALTQGDFLQYPEPREPGTGKERDQCTFVDVRRSRLLLAFFIVKICYIEVSLFSRKALLTSDSGLHRAII